jgi:hypothetical protein
MIYSNLVIADYFLPLGRFVFKAFLNLSAIYGNYPKVFPESDTRAGTYV